VRLHFHAVIEPYSFHCTPCGSPHAGECPPRPKGRPPGTFPAEGTSWRKQLNRGDAIWDDCQVWTVVSFDAAESDNVVVRRAGEEGRLDSSTHIWPVAAWDEMGTPLNFGCRIRFWGPLGYSDFKPNP